MVGASLSVGMKIHTSSRFILSGFMLFTICFLKLSPDLVDIKISGHSLSVIGTLKPANMSRNYHYNYVDLWTGDNVFIYPEKPDLTSSDYYIIIVK